VGEEGERERKGEVRREGGTKKDTCAAMWSRVAVSLSVSGVSKGCSAWSTCATSNLCQHTATRCNTLQHTAHQSNTL